VSSVCFSSCTAIWADCVAWDASAGS